jgi:NADH-quinone oxidoreductase subunit A
LATPNRPLHKAHQTHQNLPENRLQNAVCVPTFTPMESQLQQYIPVLLLGLLAVLFSFGMLGFSVLVGWKGKRSRIKDTAYECGMLPIGAGNTRMSIKFYLVAMLFILFDIEVVFFYPWAVVYKQMLSEPATKNLILGSMVTFMFILFIGYIYAFKKKAFEWRQ